VKLEAGHDPWFAESGVPVGRIRKTEYEQSKGRSKSCRNSGALRRRRAERRSGSTHLYNAVAGRHYGGGWRRYCCWRVAMRDEEFAGT
jgi:hypothetical protein